MSIHFRIVLLALLLPAFLFAQAAEDEGSTPIESSSSSRSESDSDASGVIKFRGFKSVSALEDLPSMMSAWRVSFFQLASLETARLDDSEPVGMFFYNFLSFNYRLGHDARISVRPTFTLQSPGMNRNRMNPHWETRWDDWYVQLSKFNLFELGVFGTRGNFRVYGPTSERSRDNGMITRLRPEFYMETSFRRGTGMEIGFRGDYYVQSQKTVTFRADDGSTRVSRLMEAELESYIEINQKINRKFFFRPRLTWFDEWRYGSPANNLQSTHTTRFAAAAGLDWRPTENFNMLIQYANQTTFFVNRQFLREDDYFDPNNNQLVVLTNYRF